MPAFLNLIGHLSLFDIDELVILALYNILGVQSTVVIKRLFQNFYYTPRGGGNTVTGTSVVGTTVPKTAE